MCLVATKKLESLACTMGRDILILLDSRARKGKLKKKKGLVFALVFGKSCISQMANVYLRLY